MLVTITNGRSWSSSSIPKFQGNCISYLRSKAGRNWKARRQLRGIQLVAQQSYLCTLLRRKPMEMFRSPIIQYAHGASVYKLNASKRKNHRTHYTPTNTTNLTAHSLRKNSCIALVTHKCAQCLRPSSRSYLIQWYQNKYREINMINIRQ